MRHSEHETFYLKLILAVLIALALTFGGLFANPDIVVQSYTVKSGDTLFSLARRFASTPAQIRQLNNMSSKSTIYVGKKLLVPRNTVHNASIAPKTKAPLPTEKYVIKRGDSLSKISKIYHTEISEIMRVNKLRNANQLRVGQVLILPKRGGNAAPLTKITPRKNGSGYIVYRVQNGDTWYGLAKKFGVKVSTLTNMNQSSPNETLQSGQLIKAPPTAAAQQTKPNVIEKLLDKKLPAKLVNHTVRDGDTFLGIANKYGYPASFLPELRRINGMSPNQLIYVGQVLKIPLK